MNPYMRASKIQPITGQRYAVIGYHFENTTNKNGADDKKMLGAITFFSASDNENEMLLYAEYLHQDIKLPNVIVVEAMKPTDVCRYSEGVRDSHEPMSSARSMIERHREDKDWFHPTYQVRKHANIIKLLASRNETINQKTSYLLAQMAEWKSEMSQMQKIITELADLRIRTAHELQSLGGEWNDPGVESIIKDQLFFKEMQEDWNEHIATQSYHNQQPQPVIALFKEIVPESPITVDL
jgi:hypothetical protein